MGRAADGKPVLLRVGLPSIRNRQLVGAGLSLCVVTRGLRVRTGPGTRETLGTHSLHERCPVLTLDSKPGSGSSEMWDPFFPPVVPEALTDNTCRKRSAGMSQ